MATRGLAVAVRGGGVKNGDQEEVQRLKRRPAGHWEVEENRKAFLEEVEKRLHITSAEQWKRVRLATVADLGGSGLLQRYGNSMSRMLADCGPASVRRRQRGVGKRSGVHIAMDTRQHMPKGFWKSRDNCKQFLLRFAEANDITSPSGWKKITKREVLLGGGNGLLLQYSGSLVHALHDTLYRNIPPELLHGGKSRARGYWDEPRNRRHFLASFCRDADVELPSDWKRITANQVVLAGGGGLIKKFGGSLALAVRSAFYEMPLGAIDEQGEVLEQFWRDRSNVRQFFDRIRSSLGIETFLDMGKITEKHVEDAGGEGLLKQHGGSALAALTYAFEGRRTAAAYSWEDPSFWRTPDNVRMFLREVAERYGWISLPLRERWNHLTKGHVVECGGRGLLAEYDNTLLRVLQCAYPEGRWSVTSTREVIDSLHWRQRENIASFIRYLAHELSLKDPEDWYRVSLAQLRENGASGMLKTVSLYEALAFAYPSINWEHNRLAGARSKKASQRHLAVLVAAIFPEESIWHKPTVVLDESS